LAQSACNLEFVSLADCSAEEDQYLRRVLIQHCLMTGSPRAAMLLRATGHLPLVRVQPKQLPCSLEQTWEPILHRLGAPSTESSRLRPLHSEMPALAPLLLETQERTTIAIEVLRAREATKRMGRIH
jgi:hypothetical protein